MELKFTEFSRIVKQLLHYLVGLFHIFHGSVQNRDETFLAGNVVLIVIFIVEIYLNLYDIGNYKTELLIGIMLYNRLQLFLHCNYNFPEHIVQ